MTLQDDIQLALKTWYPKEHKLHYSLDHPTMKLAGEAGELLDLYAKHKYKPNFDWWQCKICGKEEIDHEDSTSRFRMIKHDYTSLVLDELGDWWYYWRILAYLIKIEDYPAIFKHCHSPLDNPDVLGYLLSELLYASSFIRKAYTNTEEIIRSEICNSFSFFINILECVTEDETSFVELDYITHSNYQKLNSEGTNHGWKGA